MWEWAGYELSILSQVLKYVPSCTIGTSNDVDEIVQNLEELGNGLSVKDKLCLSCQILSRNISEVNYRNGYYSAYYRTNYNLDNKNAEMLQSTIANTPLNDECLV